jgi:transposase
MPMNFRISDLAPVGLIVESITQLDDAILVAARAGIQVATCPLCGSPSRRVHSRYVREVSDLPCSGRSVRLRIVARRFCCGTPHCRRRIFAERFDQDRASRSVTPDRPAGLRRSSSWIGPRRQAGSELRQASDATSKQ